MHPHVRPTQRDHFYLVNSSGAYHIGWYYGYGHQNKTLSRLLARVKRSVLPVTGKLGGNYVVFSFNSSTYRVPVRELSPYLWDTELLDSLVAFLYGKGIVIVPSVEVDVVENNFTVIKKPGERVGTTLLDFNFTYLLSYRYPRYLNGTVGGRFLWKNSSRKTEPITYDELSRMFDEPFYAFYFDGSILRPYPLMGIEILPELREFQLSVKYRFENLARPYELPSVSTTGQSSTASSTNTHFKPLSSTDNSNTYHGSGNVGGRNHLWPLLLVVILSLVLAKLLTSRRH